MAQKKQKTTRPVGKPTKYLPQYCEMIIEHMKGGKSHMSFCASIDIHFDTSYEWMKVHSEYSDAYKMARMHCMVIWEEAGMKASLGKIPGFNTAAYCFLMKNMFGWQDNPEAIEDKQIRIEFIE